MAKNKKTYRMQLDNFCGFEYLVAENLPVYDDEKYGPIIDLPPRDMELMAAIAIVENSYPLRGREIHLFRSVLQLSLERFAAQFSLSGAGVLKWERDPEKRLDLANEWMIRSFMAEKLNIKKQFIFSEAMQITDSKSTQKFSIKLRAS